LTGNYVLLFEIAPFYSRESADVTPPRMASSKGTSEAAVHRRHKTAEYDLQGDFLAGSR
jgi:hypothetical protein